MERSTMFLHSLLVLLVVIQVTIACYCKPLTLLQAMCNSYTVVEGSVSDGKPEEIEGVLNIRYKLDIIVPYRYEDSNIDHNIPFEHLLFPQKVSDCGGTLDEDEDYLFVGKADKNGDLVSNTCYFYQKFKFVDQNQPESNILLGIKRCED